MQPPPKRIVLFTTFPPETGGGGTCLRSLISCFSDVEVHWCYLGKPGSAWPNARHVGEPLLGGPLIRDLLANLRLWRGGLGAEVEAICTALEDLQPDAYWIVAHNEGIPVGLRLLEKGKKVHVTVHDDQEFGMFGRSTRYRPIARITRGPTRRLLQGASSVDVISEEMGAYYKALLGVESLVTRPVVPSLPVLGESAPAPQEISVGHIGTVYSVPEVNDFCAALARVAQRRNLQARVLFIGRFTRSAELLPRAGLAFEFNEHLEDDAAAARLAQCNFVYAMYPFHRISEIFRQTSLPTKLTSYLKSRRSIFAHTRQPSSLANFIRRTGLGVVCDSREPADLEGAIGEILCLKPAADSYEQVRSTFYGLSNARQLQTALLALTA